MIPVPAWNVKVEPTGTPVLRAPIYVRIDRIGQVVPGLGRVVFTRPPPPVYITPFTRVEFVEPCRIKFEELQHNILVTVSYPRRKMRRYLIYPKKVWENVWKNYLEPMHRGDPPKEPGLLLYGPKGTGKSSIITLTGDFLGMYIVNIDVSFFSRYIGESEKNFMEKLLEAERNEPSLVNMDEMDSLVRKREMLQGGEGALVYNNIIAILLRKMPEYKKSGRRVLIILATNNPPSMIDDALMRHERFGSPVFVPPPDYEAIRTILHLHEIDKILPPSEVDFLAYRLSALGVSMADVVRLIEEVKSSGRIPDLTMFAVMERGYKRPYPAKVPDIDGKILDSLSRRLRPFTEETARLLVLQNAYPYQICEAVLTVVLALLNRPLVVLTDPRKFDEALHTAEIVKSVLIVPADYMSSDVLSYVHLNAKVPVWFISTRTILDIPTFQMSELEEILGIKNLLQIALSYYGMEIDRKKLMRIESRETVRRVLRQLPFRKGTVEDILRDLGLKI